MRDKPRAYCLLLVLFATVVLFSGCAIPAMIRARQAREAKAAAQKTQPPTQMELRRIRDSQTAYAELRKDPKALPQIPDNEREGLEYAAAVYSGIFYEALINRDFDLIDRAADEARESKEQTLAGVWKLERIYDGLEHPRVETSDAEWKRHIRLLREWEDKNPDSQTAPIAVAVSMFKWGWYARGHGYADSVTSDGRKLFIERVQMARNVLTAITDKASCPMWYSLMLQIALSEGWDRDAYDELWEHAVEFEPTWYEYYRQKVIYLLPKWHGEPGDLEAYANTYATRKDEESARIYFLIMQCASATDKNERQKPLVHYAVFKQGFVQMRQTYGVTTLTATIAMDKALLAHDDTFARELFPTLAQPNAGIQRDKPTSEVAVNELKKQPALARRK